MSDHNEPLLEEKKFEDPDPLTRQQVNQALMDIEDIHPLRSRVKFDHILPVLKIFRKCIKKKPDFKHSLRKTLLDEMKIKMPKSENQIIEDPFLILGYGVNAYFDIMLSLCFGLITITVFCLPLFYFFSHNAQLGLLDEGKYVFNQFTLGNMGGASVHCNQKRVGTNEMTMNCPNGIMIVGESAQIGMMSSEIEMKTSCTEQSIWDQPEHADGAITNCSATMDIESFKTTLEETCHGKKSCRVNIEDLQPAGTSDNCGDEAYVFVQLPCEIPEDESASRKIQGLVVASVGVLVYLFTVVYYDYIKSYQSTSYVDWDVKTITAGDYTIEFDLDPETYEAW